LGGSNSDEVIGVRYGKKDPSLKKFILLGGHCDVTCGSVNTAMQGGNDNTTGQVAVLEACRVHQYYKFDYTILYCSFNGEETGLNGSKATCTYLKNLGAQTIGGNFSYDMFGMSKSNMTFSVYDKLAGAAEFQKKLEDMKSNYKLVQPTTIKSTTSIITNTDAKNILSSGFNSIYHNFAMTGAGSIHTTADKMMPSYDKVHQADCAKLGIITTADYAGINPTSIKDNSAAFHSLPFKYISTTSHMVFVFNEQEKMRNGKLEFYNFQGKLIKTIMTGNSKLKIVWDGTNNDGAKIASCSVILVKYITPATTASIRVVMK
jgi:hypothetical protein